MHGWPQEVGDNHGLVKLFEKKKYIVVKPYFLGMQEELNFKNVLKKVEMDLGGKNPDVIVGMSMSGLYLPKMAQKYPKAKIIVIASAARFAPKTKTFTNLVKLISWPIFGDVMVNVILLIAPVYMKWWYRQLTSNGKSGKYLQQDIDRTVADLRKVNFRKHAELARMIVGLDNREIWKTINNPTLILSGSEDIVMPEELGQEIANLAKNSKIFVTNSSHYDVLNRETYEQIEKFL